MNATTPAERRQHLCFRLAGADYAVGILQVREILQFTDLTRVPGVPPSVRGVINLRGTVVPVIDLAVKFGLGETPVGRRTCVLIVEAAVAGERLVLGVMADEVREVLELGPDDVERPPSFGTQVRVDFLAGMGKLGKGFALLLDLDKVLSAEDGAYLARAAEGPAAPAPAAAPS